jgi:hypothetical protein
VEFVYRCSHGACLAPQAVRPSTTGCSRRGMRSPATPAGPRGEALEHDGVTTPVDTTVRFTSSRSPAGIVLHRSGIRTSIQIRGPAPPRSSP